MSGIASLSGVSEASRDVSEEGLGVALNTSIHALYETASDKAFGWDSRFCLFLAVLRRLGVASGTDIYQEQERLSERHF